MTKKYTTKMILFDLTCKIYIYVIPVLNTPFNRNFFEEKKKKCWQSNGNCKLVADAIEFVMKPNSCR